MKECLAILLALLVLVSYSRKTVFHSIGKNANESIFQYNKKYEQKHGHELTPEELKKRTKELQGELDEEIKKHGSFFLPNATPEDCAKFKNPLKRIQTDKK
jgi:hypothetical protein